MIMNQGRDTTIDPYYFAQLRNSMSSSDINKIQAQVDVLSESVNKLSSTVDELKQDGAKIQVKSSEDWGAEENNTSYLGLIYIYQDNIGGQLVQQIKVGDGVTKPGDLSFISTSNVTQAEKDYWNNKVSVSLNKDDENLIFIK